MHIGDLLDATDVSRISEALARASGPHPLDLTVVLHEGGADPELSEGLSRLAQQLVSVAGVDRIAIERRDATGVPAVPALSLGRGGRSGLHFMALPEGPEKAPFVEAVLGWVEPRIDTPPWTRELSELADPAEILVFVAAGCPHCPHAVRVAAQAALASERIDVSVIDVQRFESLAERYAVRSVPLTVIDGGLSVVGVPAGPDLARKILSRGATEHEAELLRSLVEGGRFAEAAEKLRTPLGCRLFVQAWAESTTSLRMGLMLAAQAMLETAPTGLDPLVPELIAILDSTDPALRGDTADLLGQIGHPDARAGLQSLLNDSNPDVAEIASDSLQILR